MKKILLGIVLFIIIVSGVIVTIYFSQNKVSTLNQTNINDNQQNDNVFLAQSKNEKGEVVFGGINVEKKVYKKILKNKIQLVLNLGKTEQIIKEIEFDGIDDNYKDFGPINFSPLGNYVIFNSQQGNSPGNEDVYNIKTGKVADLGLCGARGGDIEFTPDEKYFYTYSQNGICSATDVFVYNASDFSKKFRLTDKQLLFKGQEDISNVNITYGKDGKFLRITVGDEVNITKEFKYYFETGKLVTTNDIGEPEVEL